MEIPKQENNNLEEEPKKMSKTSKIIIGGLVGAMTAGAMPGEVKGEVISKDMQKVNSHELVLKDENREAALEMAREAIKNPKNIEEIIIKYAWKEATGNELKVKHVNKTIRDFNEASSSLSLEDQKKLRGFYEILGKYGSLPADRVVGRREIFDQSSSSTEEKTENLERARKFIEKIKSIPDQKNALNKRQNEMMQGRVVEVLVQKYALERKGMNEGRVVSEDIKNALNEIKKALPKPSDDEPYSIKKLREMAK